MYARNKVKWLTLSIALLGMFSYGRSVIHVSANSNNASSQNQFKSNVNNRSVHDTLVPSSADGSSVGQQKTDDNDMKSNINDLSSQLHNSIISNGAKRIVNNHRLLGNTNPSDSNDMNTLMADASSKMTSIAAGATSLTNIKHNISATPYNENIQNYSNEVNSELADYHNDTSLASSYDNTVSQVSHIASLDNNQFLSTNNSNSADSLEVQMSDDIKDANSNESSESNTYNIADSYADQVISNISSANNDYNIIKDLPVASNNSSNSVAPNRSNSISPVAPNINNNMDALISGATSHMDSITSQADSLSNAKHNISATPYNNDIHSYSNEVNIDDNGFNTNNSVAQSYAKDILAASNIASEDNKQFMSATDPTLADSLKSQMLSHIKDADSDEAQESNAYSTADSYASQLMDNVSSANNDYLMIRDLPFASGSVGPNANSRSSLSPDNSSSNTKPRHIPNASSEQISGPTTSNPPTDNSGGTSLSPDDVSSDTSPDDTYNDSSESTSAPAANPPKDGAASNTNAPKPRDNRRDIPTQNKATGTNNRKHLTSYNNTNMKQDMLGDVSNNLRLSNNKNNANTNVSSSNNISTISKLPQTGDESGHKVLAAILLSIGVELSALNKIIDKRRRYDN